MLTTFAKWRAGAQKVGTPARYLRFFFNLKKPFVKEEDVSSLKKKEEDFAYLKKKEEDVSSLKKKEEDVSSLKKKEEDVSSLEKKEEDVASSFFYRLKEHAECSTSHGFPRTERA
jgi:hypothetical protein